MSRIRLYFDRKPVETFVELIDMYGRREFESPFRSTIPLLSFVRDDFTCFKNMLPPGCDTSIFEIHFEWKTASQKGNGRASQTDAMVFCPNAAVAIEAKWTEGPYELLSDRFRPDHADLLDGWLAHIRPYADSPISLETLGRVPYQMVHRAASVCAAAADRHLQPLMVYLHFHETQTPSGCTTYNANLSDFRRLLGSPDRFDFFLAEVALHPTASFEALRRLKKGRASTADHVIPSLKEGALFQFATPSIARICNEEPNQYPEDRRIAYAVGETDSLVRERGLTSMTDHAHQLLKDVLRLSPAERVELLDQILASLDSDYRERIEAEWAIEIEDRIAALDKGEMPTVPAEEVYERYRDRWRK